MIKVENIAVSNFEGAIRGMRNPLNSWEKSDSWFTAGEEGEVGEKDLALAQKLILSGTDHSKFMRQIFISMDITAPLYWWKEMDTYKVGTVANSTSTMHTLCKSPITKDKFSFDNNDLPIVDYTYEMYFDDVLTMCENLRKQYCTTGDKCYWRALIQLLPNAWNQTRTWTANYQVLRHIYHSRKNHKLFEWHTFCEEIEKLPYSKELITLEKKDD